MDTKTCLICSTKEFSSYLEGIQVSPLMKYKPASEPVQIPVPAEHFLEDLYISDTLYCSYCSAGFLDKHQQRAHYKLDWHRYNLKQHLTQRKTISEDKFFQLADDVSSISGSESESDTETELNSTDVESSKEDARLTHLIARRSRVLYNNSSGQVISVPRCLLLNKKEEAVSDDYLVDLIKKLPHRTSWFIVMLGGGHFAAALFKGSDAVLHKTFHSYTVRSKQGGNQSAKDGKGSHSKSAGASLRRYNEQSHSQHICDLMKAWAPDIVKCDLIFYRAVGKSNTGILFGGANPPLLRNDPRVKNIPFPTRRATFNEVKRIHTLLSTAFIYDSNEMFRTTFSPPTKEVPEIEKKWTKCTESSPKGSPRKNNIDRAKERPSPVRELPDIVQQLAAISTSASEDDLVFVNEELSFIDSLKEFDDTVPRHVKNSVNRRQKQKRKKKEIPKDEKEIIVGEEVKELWKAVHSSCQEGDFEKLKDSLENKKETITSEDLSLILNEKNILGETILHNMSAASKDGAVRLLMMYGADPNIRDKRNQTPYDHAPDKITRNVFRRFRGEFPEKHDYSKSHIPDALTEELEAEISEKKRLAKKAKRQKDKERRIAAETNKREDDEKIRFLKLSDREKRALAAERRVLKAGGRQGVVLTRCYECAIDITGKVPFEYSDKRFCSMACLKKHRSKEKKQAS